MGVFTLCEQAIGLVRGKRLILSDSEKTLLESLNYEGLTSAHAQDEAVVCALHFARVRDKLLMMYAWKFARRYYAVPATNVYSALSLNIAGWKYTAETPTDSVSVLGVIDGDNGGALTEYEEVAGTIRINTLKPTIIYTSKNVLNNLAGWPSVFVDAFVSFLAAEIAPAVTGSFEAVEYCTKKGQQAVSEARQLGLISSEITNTLQDELKMRALNLARAQRTVSSTSEAAVSSGLDIAGRSNYRSQSEEQACIRAYDSVRDRLLQLYPWVFARKSRTLTNMTVSCTNWSRTYEKPDDCMKILSVLYGDEPIEYEEVDGCVCCSANLPVLEYTAKVTDMEQWTGAFRDVFCYSLAQEIILATTHNLEAIQLLEQKAQSLIRDAIKIGAIRYDFRRSVAEEIYNRAISLVRGQRIPSPAGDAAFGTDITGDINYREREALAVCERSIKELRDRLLKSYGWKFARKTATLTSTSKISGWDYAYNLPSDSIKILAVLSNNEPVDYEESDGLILCNSSGNMTVRYTRTVTKLSELDVVFREVLCYELAQEISEVLTWNEEHIASLEQKKQSLIQNAYRTGAIIEETHIPLKEELYNRAINLVRGQRTIKSTSDASQSGGLDHTGIINARELSEIRACNLAAPKIRDRLLQLYPWVFARKSVDLSGVSQVSGWEYGYALPEDCLTVLTVLSNGEPVDWEISGGNLYSNGKNVTARYTARVSEMSKWPAVFCDAFVYALASEIAAASLGATEIISVMEQKLSGIIQDAYKIGAIKTEPRIPAKHQLYNRAIGLIKGLKTGSPDMLDTRYEDEISACARSFAGVRDRLLQLYDWVFARKTDTPARLSDGVPGWRYTYALPLDCLKVVSVIAHDKRADFRLERGCMNVSDFNDNIELIDYETAGNELYSNREAVYVRYTARIEDTEQWAPAFTEAFVVMLAEEVALNVVEDKRVVQILEEKFVQIINEAKQNRLIRNDTGLQKQRDSQRKNIREAAFLDYSGIPTLACSPIDYCGRGYSENANEFCYW